MIIRLSTATDRETILAFIARCGFNPRDGVAWDGLKMQAMTAWEGDQLIGAIPFEPREVWVSATQKIRTIHETVVSVDPAYRGRGIGSQLQGALCEHPPAGAQLITVFREDPESPAYRWYQKNGFAPRVNIQSWFKDNPLRTETSGRLWKAEDSGAPWYLLRTAGKAGRVVRDILPWLSVHPYRNRYSFWIVADEFNSAALLGVGTMHSQSTRVDVLETVASSLEAFENLLNAIGTLANEKQWRPVRVPLASNDPYTEILRSLNFSSRWTFDLLARSIAPMADLGDADFSGWRYAGIDYI